MMSRLEALAEEMIAEISGAGLEKIRESERRFIEYVTFTDVDEIIEMLNVVIDRDWMALPPWVRNLSYRLAFLQRTEDPKLLREAGADLYKSGPDWDEIADSLEQRAEELERIVEIERPGEPRPNRP
ncbi:hypothetical protein [Streptomyces sp. BE303]|uniref:hypothetical protein n=1 Tax=Streptomyces sp. BE303 TaxID=3002528 RepID=UPI002E790A13|nr:hypothetical protein [Streptomyces sp. BE303]MED7947859.1 hypothetical protein [Streptomyces sp. BE303]